MRVAAWLVLSGCFGPTVNAGDPCESGDRWCPAPLVCGEDLICHDTHGDGSRNVVFLSSKPAPLIAFADVHAADAFCQSLTSALPSNTYRAWLSTSSEDARDRIPASARGFVRTDGQPFADSVMDIELGHIYTPLDVDENTQPAPANAPVFTATAEDGTFIADPGGDGDCFRTRTGTTRAGEDDATMVEWTNSLYVSCAASARLYCFGTDNTTPLVKPANAPGKRVFLSARNTPVGGGSAAFDQVCQQDASDAHLTGQFFALVATDTTAASDPLPPNTGWHRLDEVVAIGPTFDLIVPINVEADGTYADEHTWTGATGFKQAGTPTSSCNGWTSTGAPGTPSIGHATRSSSGWFSGTGGDCTQTHHLYCIER